MSHTLSIEQAAAKLVELVGSMGPDDEIVLTQNDQPVARILPSPSQRRQRQAGRCKGMLVIHQEGDEHLRDFEGYMP